MPQISQDSWTRKRSISESGSRATPPAPSRLREVSGPPRRERAPLRSSPLAGPSISSDGKLRRSLSGSKQNGEVDPVTKKPRARPNRIASQSSLSLHTTSPVGPSAKAPLPSRPSTANSLSNSQGLSKSSLRHHASTPSLTSSLGRNSSTVPPPPIPRSSVSTDWLIETPTPKFTRLSLATVVMPVSAHERKKSTSSWSSRASSAQESVPPLPATRPRTYSNASSLASIPDDPPKLVPSNNIANGLRKSLSTVDLNSPEKAKGSTKKKMVKIWNKLFK